MWRELEALGIDLGGRTSGHIRTTCPWCSAERHKQRVKCLSVDVSNGAFLCHHCGKGGGVGGQDWRREVFRDTRPAPAYTKPAYQPEPDADVLPQKAADWLRSRGITEPVWRRNRIESRRVWLPQLDREALALCFPYFRAGEVVNVKYRGPQKSFRMEKGAELCLYGLDDILPDAPLIWVEGEGDKLACEVAGYPNCVSVPNGAPPPGAKDYSRHFQYLDSAETLLRPIRRHLIAVDADAPGRALHEELVRRLGPERCWSVTWPENSKDANDVLIQHGADALRQCLEDARPVPVEGLFTADDLRAEIADLYANGLAPGEHPGLDALAEYYTVKPGQLSVVTGSPSHGKSAWLDNVLVSLAERVGWTIGVCSPENQPLARHMAQLLQIYKRLPFGTGPRRRMTPEERDDATAWLAQHFTFILPPDEDFTLDNILAKARAAVYRTGIRGLVIDPWNELEHLRPAGMTETEYISEALTRIRRFARAHGVHVWVVVHPTKLQKTNDGAYPVPTLYDCSGSANWRNKADMGVVVWRDVTVEDAPTQVHVQKVRFAECGKVGMVELYFDRATTRFSERRPVLAPWEVADVSAAD